MQLVRLENETDFEGWRTAARSLLTLDIAPEEIQWRVSDKTPGLFDTPEFVSVLTESQDSRLSVPRDFIKLCRTAILYRDPARFGLLYRLLWRLRNEPSLLQIAFDPDVIKLKSMAQAVQRDLHKMKAFVRFREIKLDEGVEFIAWFEPSHYIVEASASFFTGRFSNMRWSILTPDICMHWDGASLSFTPGAKKADAPTEDAGEELWRAYYRNIFNPARLKVSTMQAQMPKKYWRNLPEAPLIAGLIADSAQRMDAMITSQPTQPLRKIVKYIPNKETSMSLKHPSNASNALRELNELMLTTTEFPLAELATQAVFGVGPVSVPIMLIGEQPGDQEDLAGQPFVGPAGKLLDSAFRDAGMDRSKLYLTNAVKHFKFTIIRNRRQHRSPDVRDLKLYLPWLESEMAIVQPQLIIALGAVAARAVTGKAVTMESSRGKLFSLKDDRHAIVTYHPSFILRTPDKETKQLRYERLVADLKLATQAVT
jgi:probable DNA metabolism protein